MKRMLKLLNTAIAATLILTAISAVSAAEDKVQEFTSESPNMNAQLPVSVVLPNSYFSKKNADKHYPVVYLLHGYSGDFRNWPGIKKDLQEQASIYNVIIVCPDGSNSWYWDSLKNPSSQFETYITQELIPQVDQRYRTIDNRNARAITGLSMGGHGAMWLAIKNKNIFGACGSMSGGLDIRPFPDNWDMKNQLGEYKDNPEVWDSHTVINAIETLKPNELQIIIDCGYDDFFYQVNLATHDKLLNLKIPHDFIIRPGAHNWEYWNNSVDYQLLFFSKFFKQHGY